MSHPVSCPSHALGFHEGRVEFLYNLDQVEHSFIFHANNPLLSYHRCYVLSHLLPVEDTNYITHLYILLSS